MCFVVEIDSKLIAWDSSTIYGYACSPFTNVKYNHAMDY